MLREKILNLIRRNGQRLDQLAAAMPGRPEDRLTAYRADPARLMTDAGFTPDAWQAEFLRSTDARNLILCGRQIGKSLAVALKALCRALTTANSTVVVIAPIEPQANELVRKVLSCFNAIGRPIPTIREAVTTLEFANGSRVIALPGKERSVHSYTADLLIVDEAARVPDEVYHSASPQLSASKGTLVALSTAFSKSGWFFKEWQAGKEFRRWSITAHDCPRHSKEFLANERLSMGPRWFDMAYMNVFGDDVAAVFSSDDIRAAVNNDLEPLFPQPKTSSNTGPINHALKPLFGD
ncbi:MAG TPA: terminase family protein [Gemmataceae bacterium]